MKNQNIRLISRLDIKGKNLIKGIQLEGFRVIGCPSDFAEKYYNQGADELIYMDAVASLYGRNHLAKIIQEAAKNIFIPLTVGGGIRSMDRIEMLINYGIDRVIVGTGAVENNLFLQEIRRSQYVDKIIFALDFNIKNQKPMLSTHGWSVDSKISLYDYLKKNDWIKNILATDISLDGTLKGPNKNIYQKIITNKKFKFTASGGIGNIEDLFFLKSIGADECVVGKAIYENKISMEELKSVN